MKKSSVNILCELIVYLRNCVCVCLCVCAHVSMRTMCVYGPKVLAYSLVSGMSKELTSHSQSNFPPEPPMSKTERVNKRIL